MYTNQQTKRHEVCWQKTSQTQSYTTSSKGKKNKRRSTKESDWRDYWGSPDPVHLKEDVETLGEDPSKRNTIIDAEVYRYLEAREQFEREVLLTDDYYNGITNKR